MQEAPCEICLLLSAGQGGMELQHLATMKGHPTREKENANKKMMLTATIEISKKISTDAADDNVNASQISDLHNFSFRHSMQEICNLLHKRVHQLLPVVTKRHFFQQFLHLNINNMKH